MSNAKGTILVVEDDSSLLEMLTDFLSLDFGNVIKAVDGISAFLAVNENIQELDLIFTDIKMPGWDGLQFVTSLRSQGINTPVVFTSGTSERDDIVKALRLGAVDFVPKPYRLEEVRSAIYRVLEISRRESEVANLIEKHGKDSEEVTRQNKLIGRFRVVNVAKKTA